MKKLLIANRGEIARRIIRTAHEMGIQTVAVYSDADAASLHVREASVSYALGGNASADTYLRIDKLLAAAKATGANAIHPGYGFLSENADFAQAVVDDGLIWVGPPPAAIRALGSKSSAKQLAMAKGVPCLPGYQGEDQSDERFATEAARIGFPVMVKATAGGGGRGMRLVTEATQLQAALASARSEALSSFGSAELLIERALLNPRHVEVQVFADTHGNCIHLGERDCSVQRRHQKIIEEAPSPAVDAALRERLGSCAVALAQGAGYVGAGTVEFLLQDGAFYLMEMNTRLQVEHPVTEFLTGLDLVAWQLQIAQGRTLPLTQDQVQLKGHAIEVRLCAEDENHIPHTGTVKHFNPPGAGLRFDHALEMGSVVSPHYDAMLGKLIAHGATRDEAIDHLLQGLTDLQVLGLPTNRAFLAICLDHAGFRAGAALIPFLASKQGTASVESLQKQEQKRFSVPKRSFLPTIHLPKTLPLPLRVASALPTGGGCMTMQFRSWDKARPQSTANLRETNVLHARAKWMWAAGMCNAASPTSG
ncbi:MAG: ATP-grasp domain-containing protein [Betaproteobacteria bacterium]|nr:ATP-grasp domain-containing protein [Betaproteobacteria bacterium]